MSTAALLTITSSWEQPQRRVDEEGAVPTSVHSGLLRLLLLLLVSRLVVSGSVRPDRWQPTRLRRPWDSPGKNTGVGCHCLPHNGILVTHKKE